MKKITLLLTILTLAFSSVSGQTVFDWDTNAVDNGDNVTETIDGITVTFSGGANIALLNGQGASGTSGLIVWHSTKITSVTFTFDQPVNVNSILPIDAYGGSMDYTFTPTGGTNSAVVASIVGGVATTGTVDLNWVGVTSFTVTASDSAGAGFGFDNLSVSPDTSPPTTVFDWDTNAVDNGDNVTETIDGITVTFSGGPNIALLNGQGASGTSGLIVWHSTKITSVTFTFDQPVNVNSILPIDAYGGSMDYTFTPTGGTNSAVVASIVGGVATTGTVDLNWVGVTSFTVTASDSAGAGFGFDNLSVSPDTSPPTTVFDWDTNAVDNGDNVTETIDGITVTFSGGPNIALLNGQGASGTSGLIVWHSTKITSVTFTFDQPVNVNSILPIDAYGGSMDYTFTPTGGTNSAVVASIVGGVATTGTVDLNWVGVTSFTVTASDSAGAGFGFDNLSVSPDTSLSVTDAYVSPKVLVYPNPVANTLYIKNILDLKSINVYNHLGQLVLQSKEATIDVSHLLQGMYFLQINTNQGIETKRIIKK